MRATSPSARYRPKVLRENLRREPVGLRVAGRQPGIRIEDADDLQILPQLGRPQESEDVSDGVVATGLHVYTSTQLIQATAGGHKIANWHRGAGRQNRTARGGDDPQREIRGGFRIQSRIPAGTGPTAGVGPENFTFLGFTHSCGSTRQGHFKIRRQTARKRLEAKLQKIKQMLRSRMHEPVPKVGEWLKRVLDGHYQYFGVPGNWASPWLFRERIARY
jgi:hypothetical protein